MRGQIWVLTGAPGGSNVVVQVGDQGVFIVDTGTKEMAPKLLAAIQRLAQEHAGEHKEIRKILNTNGRLDHIGGNEIIAKAGIGSSPAKNGRNNSPSLPPARRWSRMRTC